MIKIHKEKQDKAKKYHDTFKAKEELFELMKKVVFATNNGNEEDDYTKTINLNIGNGILSYDPYYQKLVYYDNDGCEYEIKEEDLEIVQKLIREIETRFEKFEREIKKIRTSSVEKLFDKPIDNILNCKK